MQGTWQISSCSPWNFASNCLLILDLTCLKLMKMKTRKFQKIIRYLNICSCLCMFPKHNRKEIYLTYMSFTNFDCQQQDIIRFQRYLDNVIFRFLLFFVDKSFYNGGPVRVNCYLLYRIGILHIRYKGIYLYVHQQP